MSPCTVGRINRWDVSTDKSAGVSDDKSCWDPPGPSVFRTTRLLFLQTFPGALGSVIENGGIFVCRLNRAVPAPAAKRG